MTPSGRFAPRLALATGALLAASVGAVGLAFTEGLRREMTEDLARSLMTQARLGAGRLRSPLSGGSAREEARFLGAACGCRATLIAPDGSLAGDSELSATALAKAENHASRPEVAEALAGREGRAVRRSSTIGVDLLYAASPAPGLGAVRLAIPLTTVASRAARARAFFLWTAALVLGAALTAAWALARSAGRPLEEMAEVARRLAAGDYGARVRGPLGSDERAVLGATLNALADRVEEDVTRLRRLEQLRRDFVANVSHELRTPLASIRGYAETLLDGALDDKENREGFVKEIEEQAKRLATLVDDLLDLSAVESGHRPPRLEPVALVALLEETARTFKAAAAERGVRLETRAPADLPPASADPEQLRQVLNNLADNAVKYTERGGRVVLMARVEAGELLVSVADTGIGIPEDDLPRVFERFYRVDKARSREAGGTGLGLAIVKHLVEAHGGRVRAESRRPGGSTFSFTLRPA